MSFAARIGWLIATTLAFSIHSVTAVAETDPSFNLHNAQLKRLLNPSAYQARREQNQKVYVYVGLHDKDVDKAMDKYFDRIESFLFASTIVTDKRGKPVYKNGQLVTESDDC